MLTRSMILLAQPEELNRLIAEHIMGHPVSYWSLHPVEHAPVNSKFGVDVIPTFSHDEVLLPDNTGDMPMAMMYLGTWLVVPDYCGKYAELLMAQVRIAPYEYQYDVVDELFGLLNEKRIPKGAQTLLPLYARPEDIARATLLAVLRGNYDRR